MWIKRNRLRRCSIWRQSEFTAQQEKGWAIYWLYSLYITARSMRNVANDYIVLHACMFLYQKWARQQHRQVGAFQTRLATKKTSDSLLSLGQCWLWLEYILPTRSCESTFPVHVFKRVVGSAASPPRSQSILTFDINAAPLHLCQMSSERLNTCTSKFFHITYADASCHARFFSPEANKEGEWTQ